MSELIFDDFNGVYTDFPTYVRNIVYYYDDNGIVHEYDMDMFKLLIWMRLL